VARGTNRQRAAFDFVGPAAVVAEPTDDARHVAPRFQGQAKSTLDAKAREFVRELYVNHIKVLGTGARDTTTAFVQQVQGDAMIAWENEALFLTQKTNPGRYQIVYPSQSILAEPPVAVVDKNVDAHGTRDVATAYLKYLYTPAGQETVAKYYYRPRSTEVLAKYSAQFQPIKLFTLAELFGTWSKVQKEQFAAGGVFDQLYVKPAK